MFGSEGVIDHRRLVHAIGSQDVSAGFRHPDRFRQGADLVLPGIQVIHRAQQHGQIIGVIRQEGKVQHVSLYGPDRLRAVQFGLQHLQVPGHQFHGSHPVVFLRQGHAVSSGSRPDLQDGGIVKPVHTFMNVFHGGQVLHLAVPGKEPVFFITDAVEFLKIIHRNNLLYSSPG